jgi:hypothetical protein
MAKDSPISYLPGTDPETVQANLEYQTALANLKDALDARKNRLFNPALASFAAAMLEPGHGGGFGEALGRSVRAYSTGEEEDIKQQQELAAKNVDIARMGLELQRQRGNDTFAQNLFARRFNPSPSAPAAQGPAEPPKPTSPLAAAAGPDTPTAAPTPPLSAPSVAGSQPSSRTFKLGPQTGMQLTQDEFIALYLRQHPGDFAGAIEAADKRNERVKVQQGYVYNPDTNEYTIPPGQPAVKFYFDGKTYEIDPADAYRLNQMRSSGDPSFNQQARRILGGQPSLEDIKVGEARALSPIRSGEAGATTASQEAAKQEAADRLAIRDAGREAGTTIAFTKTIRTLANDKQADQIFGILTTPNLLDNVASILDKGVMGIRIAGLEDALRNTGLDKEGIAKARLAAQQFNQLQIRLASAAKGAVSDYERQLFADAAINLKDPVQAIHMKNDMLEAKAAFDRNISKAFRQSKMGAEDFRDSDAYQREYQTYIERIQSIAGGKRLTETPPAAKPAAPSGEKLSVDELRKRLDKMRGQ